MKKAHIADVNSDIALCGKGNLGNDVGVVEIINNKLKGHHEAYFCKKCVSIARKLTILKPTNLCI